MKGIFEMSKFSPELAAKLEEFAKMLNKHLLTNDKTVIAGTTKALHRIHDELYDLGMTQAEVALFAAAYIRRLGRETAKAILDAMQDND